MKPTKEPKWKPEHSLVINAVVGSTVHGLNLPGSDDLDTMGICLEPPEYVIGLDTSNKPSTEANQKEKGAVQGTMFPDGCAAREKNIG